MKTDSLRESPAMTVDMVIKEIKKTGNPQSLLGMARFGIETSRAFGASIPALRALSRKIGRSHELAQELWRTGIHEARILAALVDDPARVTENQMEEWVKDFDSWDVVDSCCGNLFDKTTFAVTKAREWSGRKEEYVKRAGFVLMAELAVHDKQRSDRTFREFLPLIVRGASDERNFVKKAVNWGLRQIGKRNLALNRAAVRTAMAIRKVDSKSAKWIAADALRELTSDPVQKKLKG